MPESEPPWDGALAARYVFVPAWRTKLGSEHRAALDSWAAAQPREAEPVEMVAAAVREGQVRAAVIGKASMVDFLKRPMVVMACRLTLGERDEELGAELLRYSLELLTVWATREPDAAAGVLFTVPPDRFIASRRRPFWSDTGLMVIRIMPNGDQYRVKWFDHARF